MKLPLWKKQTALWWVVALVLMLAGWLGSARLVQGQGQPAEIQVLSTAVDEQADQVVLDIYFTPLDASGRPINSARFGDAEVQLLAVDGSRFPATISTPQTPIYIALVIDASGSMHSIMPQVKAAAQSAIDQAPPNALFTVISFHETPNIEIAANNDRGLVKNAIENITVTDRGTCLYDTVLSALDTLERQMQNPGERTAVILFTDGKDELRQGEGQPCSTRANPNSLINRATASDTGQPTPIHTIGLGTDASNSNLNVGELRNLAEQTRAFSAIGGTAELSNLFRQIMDGLNSQRLATAVVFPRAGENSAALNIQTEGNIILSDTFRFRVNRDHQTPLGTPRVNISSFRFDETLRQYEIPLTIANSAAIDTIVVEISRDNILVESIERPSADTLIIPLPINNLLVGETYLIEVKGVDVNGQYIENERGDIVLAQDDFTHSIAPPPPPNFVIQSANVDYETDQLIITLDIPEIERVENYEAILIDAGTSAQIEALPTKPLTDTVVILALPPDMRNTDGSREYLVRMELYTTDGQSIIEEFSFQPQAAPNPPGPFTRMWQALMAQPWILGIIIMIIVGVIGGLILRMVLEKRNKPAPVRPPVNDKSIIFEAIRDPVIAPSRPAMRAGYTPPAPHEDDLFIDDDPLNSSIVGDTAQHVRLTFVSTPQTQPQNEVIIESFPYVIGREGGRADLKVMGDPRISREHLRLDRRGANLTMTDLGSGNGTFLADGQACSPNRPINLNRQQQIRLGPNTIIFLEVM